MSEDLFYKEVEGKMEELKQKPPKEEKESRSAIINKLFTFLLGLMILIGLLFTLLGLLGGR